MTLINKKEGNLFSVLKGFAVSMLISIIAIWIYAVILVKTNIQENTITIVIITISGISVLIGSLISSLKTRKKRNNKWNMCWTNVFWKFIYFIKYYFVWFWF